MDKEREDIPFDENTQKYVDKNFACKEPCDSYGVCDNCVEKTLVQIGYTRGRNYQLTFLQDELERARAQILELRADRDLGSIMRDQSETHGRIALSQCHEKKQTQRMEIEALEQQLSKANEVIEQIKGFFENAPLESGVCCCGSTGCNPMIDGHSFVDSGHYAIESQIKFLTAYLNSAKLEGGENE